VNLKVFEKINIKCTIWFSEKMKRVGEQTFPLHRTMWNVPTFPLPCLTQFEFWQMGSSEIESYGAIITLSYLKYIILINFR